MYFIWRFFFSAHRSACAYTITSGTGTNIQFSLQIDKRGGIVVYDGKIFLENELCNKNL